MRPVAELIGSDGANGMYQELLDTTRTHLIRLVLLADCSLCLLCSSAIALSTSVVPLLLFVHICCTDTPLAPLQGMECAS